MEKDSRIFFRDLKDKITHYADLKLEYYKLSSYEVVGKITSKLSYGLILIIAGLWAVFFLLFAIGFILGEYFDSVGLGFLCVALLILLIMGMITICKNRIRTKILNKCLKGISSLEQELDNGYNEDEPIKTEPVGEVAIPEAGNQEPDKTV